MFHTVLCICFFTPAVVLTVFARTVSPPVGVAVPQGYVDPLTAQQVAAQAAAVVAVQASILIGGAAPTAGAGSAGSAAAEAAAAAGVDAAPSVFLSLHNLVTEADLWSDQDYEDVRSPLFPHF